MSGPDVTDTLDEHLQPTTTVSGRSRPLLAREHRSPKRILGVLAVLGFAVPLCAYIWLLAHYSVNTIYADQWSDVRLVGLAHSGHLSLSALWAQHNENRIFFPNLIMLFLAYTTNLNLLVEMYLGAAMLVASVGFFVLAHKRRSPGRNWIYYCPVAILMLSFVQFQNTLWGFQMAWYFVLLCLSVSLYFLDGESLSWQMFSVAIIAAVVGSFSSLQGLLIWPAGLVLLYHRRRHGVHVLTWIGFAAATAALYFYNMAFNPANGFAYRGYALHHPIMALKFFVYMLGAMVVDVQSPHPSVDAVLFFGIVVLVVAAIVVAACGLRRDDVGPA
ncbi:MAG: hypothetical protein ACRD6W_09855, partial [Nitrososphaerales archaeon]